MLFVPSILMANQKNGRFRSHSLIDPYDSFCDSNCLKASVKTARAL